jgi:4-deoxy-L-threo-5-hexosulose-uronate ketol-isomerase
MELRYMPDQESYRRMTTEEMRKSFVIDSLFERGEISAVYCDADRAIIGGAIPTRKPSGLRRREKEMAAEFFNERAGSRYREYRRRRQRDRRRN